MRCTHEQRIPFLAIQKIPNPRHYHARLRYLRQQQRCLARRQEGSRRREKQRLRVARAHARVRHARQAAVHALTSRLVYEFDVIVIEDLNVRALCRGWHARAMQEVAFSEIRRQLTYKCQWYGKILVTVDRWYASSKICSNCRYTLEELPLDQREWRCPKCGVLHDRDINAARNLLMEGRRQLAGRGDRDLRVDARGACSEEILAQVLAEEARSGHLNHACQGGVVRASQPKKKSTIPVSSEYSAPTTTSPSVWISSSMTWDPCRSWLTDARTFARTAW
jgi:IS605 OrfB family transposase